MPRRYPDPVARIDEIISEQFHTWEVRRARLGDS